MEDITLATPINSMTDDELKQELADNGVILHHKTGTKKLASTLAEVRTKEYKEDSNSATPSKMNNEELTAYYEKHGKIPGGSEAANAAAENHIDANEANTLEKKAMRLTRVVVVPNDPGMAQYPGLIFTVGLSGINNGRMIKKFVPFNNEEGWHVPEIILRQIESAEMQQFKTVTRPNGEKELESYITKKFNVRILEPLTAEEMKKLAASQQAAGFNSRDN